MQADLAKKSEELTLPDRLVTQRFAERPLDQIVNQVSKRVSGNQEKETHATRANRRQSAASSTTLALSDITAQWHIHVAYVPTTP